MQYPESRAFGIAKTPGVKFRVYVGFRMVPRAHIGGCGPGKCSLSVRYIVDANLFDGLNLAKDPQ